MNLNACFIDSDDEWRVGGRYNLISFTHRVKEIVNASIEKVMQGWDEMFCNHFKKMNGKRYFNEIRSVCINYF